MIARISPIRDTGPDRMAPIVMPTPYSARISGMVALPKPPSSVMVGEM